MPRFEFLFHGQREVVEDLGTTLTKERAKLIDTISRGNPRNRRYERTVMRRERRVRRLEEQLGV